jgi:inner membrane protein
MDSLTQIVLGAATGEIILGRKLGNKAILLGAIAGTIPDLDVIYNFIDDSPITQLNVHRAYSHATFTHLLLALPFAWISSKWSKAGVSFNRWYMFWFMGFFTHALLDCCTTYGTRLFLPFSDYQVAFNNVSVIDPLYTLPFLILLVACMFFKRDNPKRKKMLWASIIVSSSYMILTFGLKFAVHQKFKASLEKNNIHCDELNSTPTILNAILWSGIAYDQNTIYCAEYSFLNSSIPIVWNAYQRHTELASDFESHEMQTVKWFSDGQYFIQPHGQDSISFYSIKFGRMNMDETEPAEAFFFYYKLNKKDGKVNCEAVERRDFNFNEALHKLSKRIGLVD